MSSQATVTKDRSPGSAVGSEKLASPAGSDPSVLGSTPTGSFSTPNLRSCVVCRSRKVRCDKQTPCSNCQRASITCVYPTTSRQPRWAQRLDRLNNAAANGTTLRTLQHADPNVDKVMNRLRTLESLVKDLRGQLDVASRANSPPEVIDSGSSKEYVGNNDRQERYGSPATAETTDEKLGRLVLQDGDQSRYITSGFWSRIDDELSGLKQDATEVMGEEAVSSDEDYPTPDISSQESHRPSSERHAFLFRHKFAPPAPDLREYHPLPSQIPFLVEIFLENVNLHTRIVHAPSLLKAVRELRMNSTSQLSSADEALMFAIYYAATTSMEDDEVVKNFGISKSDITLKYRIGLEHSLAKAEFLDSPNLTLVKAFALFLFVARRHDSPRYIWMMTGLVIRMALFLGLQRDGSHFDYLTPYDREMRRRVWWCLNMLDVRSAEDQGTDLGIPNFDTKMPSNLNEDDITPETTEQPPERTGWTDLSLCRMLCGQMRVTRQIMAPGFQEQTNLDVKEKLLNEIFEAYDKECLQYTSHSGGVVHWVSLTIARLVMAKMTLIIFLPVLFSSGLTTVSQPLQDRLLTSAIEVAEYNHALNTEPQARPWRWAYQVYTHWHSIVYLLLETSRRPWSPTVERGWCALKSPWLIPTKARMDKDMRVWVPIRKLMMKAQRHRDEELKRLRGDAAAKESLAKDDHNMPVPLSTAADATTETSPEVFRKRWRRLLEGQQPIEAIQSGVGSRAGSNRDATAFDGSMPTWESTQYTPSATSSAPHSTQSHPTSYPASTVNFDNTFATSTYDFLNVDWTSPASHAFAQSTSPNQSSSDAATFALLPADPAAMDIGSANMPMDSQTFNSEFNVDLDVDLDVDWNAWFASAKGMEWE